ncbi:hypothetical protein Aperf_G00000015152 [Anoplocephala perfoliata]
MNTIERAFSEYIQDENEKMQDLIKMESNLWDECTVFAEKIEFWGPSAFQDGLKPNALKRSNNYNTSNSDDMLPEVYEFQNYLVKYGGRSGGWTDFNHQTFLKIRQRYVPSNSVRTNAVPRHSLPEELRNKFLQEITSALCLNSSADALAHEEWFVKLNELETACKAALNENRLRHKKAISARSSNSFVKDTTPRLNTVTPLTRKRQRARIMAWREAKQRELDQKLEEEQRELEERRQNEEMKRQKRVEELRARLEDYRIRRETVDHAQADKRETHENVVAAAKQYLTELDKERIRNRTSHLIQLQMERKRAKSRALEERQARLNRANSKFRLQAERDPERAIGYTELWKLRIQAQKEKDKSSQIKTPLTRTLSERRQKAVPEWRQRVSFD